MITITIIVSIIEQIIITKLTTSLSRGVRLVFSILVIFAIFLNIVVLPVKTTNPILLPDIQ
jgi:hypothetical protein